MHFDLLDDVRTDAVCTRVLTYSIRKIETQKKENLMGKIPEKLTNRNWAQRIDGKNHLIYAVNSIPIFVHSSTRFWTQFDMAKIEVSPENWLKSTFPQGFTFPILDFRFLTRIFNCLMLFLGWKIREFFQFWRKNSIVLKNKVLLKIKFRQNIHFLARKFNYLMQFRVKYSRFSSIFGAKIQA